MDGYLAVVSMRAVRAYSEESISTTQLDRILQAGRATGSSRNRQPWFFVAVTDYDRLQELAPMVFAPENIATCAAAIAVVMPSPAGAFDAGRVAQNMMVAAWNNGVGSCPNSVRIADDALKLLGLSEDRHIATILSFGFPAYQPRSLRHATAEDVLAHMNRKPLDELVRRR
jgi:nitroreductase